jgi:hypothetical protein
MCSYSIRPARTSLTLIGGIFTPQEDEQLHNSARRLYSYLANELQESVSIPPRPADVTDEEARKLLLTIDPLAALAETREQLHQRLLEQTPTDSDALAAAWEAAAAEVLEREPEPLGATP